MRTKFCVLFLLLATLPAALCPVVYGKSYHSSISSKPVHVDGYYRKDGTYVAPVPRQNSELIPDQVVAARIR